jgi:hypothetical protein
MAFRFRRSFRVLPGIRLNLSKSGVSASFGIRGAHVTVGPRGTTTSVGLPGTGLSYTSHVPLKGSAAPSSEPPPALTAPNATEEPDGNQPSMWSTALIFAVLFLLSFFAVFFFWR